MVWDWSAELICASIHGGVVPLRVTFRAARRQDTFRQSRAISNGRNVMPMPLREVLRDPTVAAAEPLVLAGRTRLGRLVTWVHTSEVLDIATLLRGGELLLVGGVSLATASPAQRVTYIQDLAAASGRGHRHRDRRAAAHRARGDGHGGRATAPAPDRAAPRRAVRRGDAVHQRDARQRVGPPPPARRPGLARSGGGTGRRCRGGPADDHPRGGGERRRHPHRAERRRHRRGPRRPGRARHPVPRRRTTRSSRRSAAPA